MSRRRRYGNWVRSGRALESDCFVNLNNGRVKHIGTTFTDGNKPKLYHGYPSLRGHLFGKVVQGILGRTRR